MQTALYSFCLRLIRKFQTIFRDIYPRYPSRRNSASDRQLIGLMGISPAILAPTGKYHYPHTFHRLFGKLFRIMKRHIYRSSFRSLGVWFLWLPRFHTGRVINVLAELIFYCQDSVGQVHRTICIDFSLHYLLATKSQNYRDLFLIFHYFQHFH